MRFPAFMFWPERYWLDTYDLTDAEHGIYLRLMLVQWNTPRCQIPNDDGWIAAKMQRSLQDIEKQVKPIIARFFKSDGNWIYQPKLLAEFQRLCKRSDWSKSLWKRRKNSGHDDHVVDDRPTPTPTPTPLKKDADEDNTKNCVVLSPAIQVLEAMGVRNDPNWHGDGGRVRAWLADGADLELDILPTIERIMAKRNGQGPPRSLKYFDQAIADAKATRLAPLPNGTPRGNGNGNATGPITALHRAGEKVLAVRAERRRREAETGGDVAKPLLAGK